jgi:hypothetical protein
MRFKMIFSREAARRAGKVMLFLGVPAFSPCYWKNFTYGCFIYYNIAGFQVLYQELKILI